MSWETVDGGVGDDHEWPRDTDGKAQDSVLGGAEVGLLGQPLPPCACFNKLPHRSEPPRPHL